MDVLLDPGWLFVGLSGVAGLFFLVKFRKDITRQRRHDSHHPRRA